MCKRREGWGARMCRRGRRGVRACARRERRDCMNVDVERKGGLRAHARRGEAKCTHVHKEKEGSERVARICVRRGRAHVHEEKPGGHACARGQKFKRQDKGDGGQLSSVDTGAVE